MGPSKFCWMDLSRRHDRVSAGWTCPHQTPTQQLNYTQQREATVANLTFPDPKVRSLLSLEYHGDGSFPLRYAMWARCVMQDDLNADSCIFWAPRISNTLSSLRRTNRRRSAICCPTSNNTTDLQLGDSWQSTSLAVHNHVLKRFRVDDLW